MSAPVGVVMARAAKLASSRKDRSNERRRAQRQILREAYPTVAEMTSEAKHLPSDSLTALVCLLADLPNHLRQAEPTALPRTEGAIGSDKNGV